MCIYSGRSTEQRTMRPRRFSLRWVGNAPRAQQQAEACQHKDPAHRTRLHRTTRWDGQRYSNRKSNRQHAFTSPERVVRTPSPGAGGTTQQAHGEERAIPRARRDTCMAVEWFRRLVVGLQLPWRSIPSGPGEGAGGACRGHPPPATRQARGRTPRGDHFCPYGSRIVVRCDPARWRGSSGLWMSLHTRQHNTRPRSSSLARCCRGRSFRPHESVPAYPPCLLPSSPQRHPPSTIWRRVLVPLRSSRHRIVEG